MIVPRAGTARSQSVWKAVFIRFCGSFSVQFSNTLFTPHNTGKFDRTVSQKGKNNNNNNKCFMCVYACVRVCVCVRACVCVCVCVRACVFLCATGGLIPQSQAIDKMTLCR